MLVTAPVWPFTRTSLFRCCTSLKSVHARKFPVNEPPPVAAVPVAVNVTAGRVPDVATSVFVPALGPSCHDPTLAIPALDVTAAPPVTEPPPEPTVNVTL